MVLLTVRFIACLRVKGSGHHFRLPTPPQAWTLSPEDPVAMSTQHSRRSFLHRAALSSAVAGLGEWAAFLPTRSACAGKSEVTPEHVRFSPETEPIVKLILDTPRE
jgi:hypothetical protein